MYMMYLGSDEVTNHEGKCQHEHFHAVTRHLGTLLAINVNVVEVDRILSGQGDHGGISHHSFKAWRQPFPHRLEPCCCHQWLPLAVDEVRTPQNLCVTMENSWDNMIPKKAQIPVKRYE